MSPILCPGGRGRDAPAPIGRHGARRRDMCAWAALMLFAGMGAAAVEPAVEMAGSYKHLVSLTDVADNYQNLGLTGKDVAIDDAQRVRVKLDADLTPQLSIRAHYEVRFLGGDTLRIRNQLPDASPVSPDAPPRFLDLESAWIEQAGFELVHGLDRLQLRWQTDDMDVTVGRQAVSWGVGRVWAPTDLFAGFAPTEIDRDEKPGVDVVRVIWHASLTTSLDLIAEPLDPDGPYQADPDASSLAARLTSQVGEYDVSALGGVVAGDRVLGGDFDGYLGDAGFRGEWVHTWVEESDQREYARALLGIDYGFARTWNPYLALEYLYNGLGENDPDDYLTRLAESSVQRAFTRGNAFNLGRNYLAAVLGLSPTARFTLSSTTLLNLGDDSVLEYVAGTWSITESVDFLLGANLGFGDSGTEFGGYSADPLGTEFRYPDFVFAYLKFYF